MDIKNKIISDIKNKNTRTIAIAFHNSPDGDCIGSAVALEKALLKIGKKVDIIIHSKISNTYTKIVGSHRVNRIMIPNKKYDLVILLDCSDPDRTVHNIRRFSKNIITIDHHYGCKPFGNLYLYEKAASVGVILYKIIEKLTPIDSDIATSLYLSVRSDTSGFKNNNTDMIAHKIAGELIFKGANIQLVNEIYEKRSLTMLRLMGQTFSDIYYDKQYKIVYLMVKNEHIKKANATYEEASMLIDYLKGVEDNEVAMLFMENSDCVRVKCRSKTINVNEIMSKFGGGGHVNASGAEIYGTDEYSIINRVIQTTKEYIDNLKKQ